MASKNIYDYDKLREMNKTNILNGSIKFTNMDNQISTSNQYKLFATGECDITNGRKYIALTSDTKITNLTKKRYNLISITK